MVQHTVKIRPMRRRLNAKNQNTIEQKKPYSARRISSRVTMENVFLLSTCVTELRTVRMVPMKNLRYVDHYRENNFTSLHALTNNSKYVPSTKYHA